MSKEKNSFVLYYDLQEQTEDFTDAQLGQLMRAIFVYEIKNETPDISDIAVKTAFRFVVTQLKRNAEKYEETRMKRQSAGKKGGQAKQVNQSVANLANATQGKQNIANLANVADNDSGPVNDTGTVNDTVNGESTTACATPAPSLKEKKKKYGEYGWVQLTTQQYERLLTELGAAALDRCITYVDESAQGTGNKNKWKDWNLTIRKCHRDGWGLNRPQEGGQRYGGYQQSREQGHCDSPAQNIPKLGTIL